MTQSQRRRAALRRYLWCALATTMLAGGAAAALPDKTAYQGDPVPLPVAHPAIAALSPAPAAETVARPSCVGRGCAGKAKPQVVRDHKQISFKAPVDFSTGAAPPSTAFNVANGDQFWPWPTVTRATPLINSVAVGDFNRDGKPDVAQTNAIAGTVSIFLGDGRGGFAPPRQHHVGVEPVFVVVGDLNRDGHLDLAVANYGSNNVSILRGDGKGGFQPPTFLPVPAPRNVAIGQFNGDGIPDLAVATSGRSVGPNSSPLGGVAILIGTETGGFSPGQHIRPTHKGAPIGVNYVAVGDFNRSGFDDLALGVGTTTPAGVRQKDDTRLTGDDVLIFLNRDLPKGATPEQPFTASEQQRLRVGGMPNAISVADLNGDRHPDLAVLAFTGHLTTLLGDGRGHFVAKATNATVGGMPFGLAAGDFNDDGVLDLVTANWYSSTVSVLQGNGDGTFQPAVDFWSGNATSSAAVGDFDGDRRADIVAGRLRNDHLALLVNGSPQPGDGVAIKRDIPYGSPTHPTNDPFAAHHTLDVYAPPKGTPSFAGPGRKYPVVFFAHGGGGINCDKTMVSYLMRSLALEGLVAVSTDYRLAEPVEDRVRDVAQAFRWTRDHVGSREFGGDSGSMFVFGYSAGADLTTALATEPLYAAEQKHIRGLIAASFLKSDWPAPHNRPSLLLTGDQGAEMAMTPAAAAFSARARGLGANSKHVIVAGRDHMTIVPTMARPRDPGRVELIQFLRSLLAANP